MLVIVTWHHFVVNHNTAPLDYRKPFKGIRIASNIEIVVGIEMTFFENIWC